MYKMVAKLTVEGQKHDFEQFFKKREDCAIHIVTIMQQFMATSGIEAKGLPEMEENRILVSFKDGSTLEGIEITKAEYEANRMVVTMTRPDGESKTWNDLYGSYDANKMVFDSVALIHGEQGLLQAFEFLMGTNRANYTMKINDCQYEVHPYHQTGTTH